MKELKFRKLRADEIELRVGATTESGFSLLLYKTARVDANVLDETVGAFNWQKKFYQVKNTMICSLGIYDEERKEFIFKDDAGDESNTEAVKGEASDSFKRAGFAWGIGRELYTSPFVWVKKDQDNGPKKSHYEVKEIDYSNNEISKLVIVNEKTKQVVFSMGSTTKVAQTTQKPTYFTNEVEINKPIAEEDKKFIMDYMRTLTADKFNAFKLRLQEVYKVSSVADLNASQGKELKLRLLRNGK